ncbi:myozenin-2 [Stegostoma tigrinum]|uniref:myozenin-2 n=1 Tax=Stegostoma tigrinum TaxID=3053191 RepID=UPI00202B2069|nr:myozenin-2 [Stegostoma tigrinum]XP_048399498.1 myozenin-2 [Stegostoma tigrinum]
MSYAALIKEKKQMASAIAQEAHGEMEEVPHLDLGKKVSVPQDVMMEELSLLANKGSKMFHMRQKRVDKFTVEGTPGTQVNVNGTVPQERTKENYRSEIYITKPGSKEAGPAVAPKPFGKLSAAKNIKIVLNPGILAPGYSGPLKEIPPEKFNITAVPKSYQSPWTEALMDQPDLLESTINQLPEAPVKAQSQTYRCFNRAPTPFGVPGSHRRLLEPSRFEAMEIQEEPEVSVEVERFANRPSFNRLARGWTGAPLPESADL